MLTKHERILYGVLLLLVVGLILVALIGQKFSNQNTKSIAEEINSIPVKINTPVAQQNVISSPKVNVSDIQEQNSSTEIENPITKEIEIPVKEPSKVIPPKEVIIPNTEPPSIDLMDIGEPEIVYETETLADVVGIPVHIENGKTAVEVKIKIYIYDDLTKTFKKDIPIKEQSISLKANQLIDLNFQVSETLSNFNLDKTLIAEVSAADGVLASKQKVIKLSLPGDLSNIRMKLNDYVFVTNTPGRNMLDRVIFDIVNPDKDFKAYIAIFDNSSGLRYPAGTKVWSGQTDKPVLSGKNTVSITPSYEIPGKSPQLNVFFVLYNLQNKKEQARAYAIIEER
ncbi:hypothetical protein COV16_05825 [Candidatus Woesearchaeota archaeon CG10_big_fil_rev_8_21_14_0_10_34_8]|nr:MAG: hypothetical protein COV16_05825 [Candidatus Woesearchaeota archaeon CG10_big_fil_rev_8_21_14_0_10_34_8]